MAIKHTLITGDTHGKNCSRLRYIQENMPEYAPEETAIIILGDCGFNYYLDSSDKRNKKQSSAYGYTIYCVRGNHEERPCNINGMKLVHDDFVNGPVWIEEEFPLIRYFEDWGIYNIQGRKVLVIGGAYSVDKWYRLQNGWRWFKDEQLTQFEMDACLRGAKDYEFDFILSHTCPLSFQPTDLFLRGLDQATVDNSMEVWLEEVKNKVKWRHWLWAHYHTDRVEAPHCEIFYYEVENLCDIEQRWKKYDETGELGWWLPLSPSMKKVVSR